MRKPPLFLPLVLVAVPASASDLTIERVFQSPALSGPIHVS